jgi:serine/threonine protein kinase
LAKFEKEFFKEFKNYSVVNNLQNEFILTHYEAWFENHDISSKLKLFIQMKICDKTLQQVINEIEMDSKLSENDILTPMGYYLASELFIEILEGMNYLHRKNIIHRDLKPLNILLINGVNENNVIKIADFGLLALHKFSEQTHTIDKGTPKYMAPEVISDEKYDIKADIYSLGIIFRELFNLEIDG